MTATSRAGGRPLTAAVALAALLVPLNSTMIAVALPDLIDAFHSDLRSVSALVAAYLITMAALQPLAGPAGDRIGRRKLIMAGLWAFLGASLGAAAASDLGTLIAFRVLQAAAGALIVPNGLALVREHAPADGLGGRLGMVGSALRATAASASCRSPR